MIKVGRNVVIIVRNSTNLSLYVCPETSIFELATSIHRARYVRLIGFLDDNMSFSEQLDVAEISST